MKTRNLLKLEPVVLLGLLLQFGLSGCSRHLQFTKLGSSQSLSPAAGGGQTSGAILPPTFTPAPLAKFQCTSPPSRGLGEARMSRLTTGELVNTLTDLLGSDITGDGQLQTQFKTLPADVIHFSVTEIAPNPPASQPSTMLNIASRVSDLVLADPALSSRIFGSCSGANPVADSCAQAFIRDFGARAFRRPLSATEASDLLTQFKASGGLDGLSAVLMELLMSPPVVFHVELGASVQGSRVRLSDYEVASRLSYRLAGTMPDAPLLQAAASGQLQDLANVRAQATRLLMGSASARAKVADFFRFYTQSDQILTPYAPAGQVNGIDTAGLQSEYVQETTDFVNHIVWDNQGKFKDLLTSTEVFPRSARMAAILETSIASGNTPSRTTAAHAGLLLRPGLFVNSTSFTKPYHRAAIIRKGYLCEQLGSPDPNALAQRMGQVGDLSHLSVRDRLTTLTNVPACLGCHSYLNPVAFSLEAYDQLGMLRKLETDFDAGGAVVGTHPIDTVVGRTFISDASGQEVSSLSDANGLAQAIANGNSAHSCFAQRVFEYQRARAFVPEDSCALSEVESAAMGGGTVLDAFINGVANEDIFWKAKGN